MIVVGPAANPAEYATRLDGQADAATVPSMEQPLTIAQVRARRARAVQLGRTEDARRWHRLLAHLVLRQRVVESLEQLDDEARADLRALLSPAGQPGGGASDLR